MTQRPEPALSAAPAAPTDPSGGCRRFVDVVALITGAGNGIGRACAVRLAAEGARVVVTDLEADDALRTVAGLADPDRHLARAMDVTDRGSVEDAVADAVRRLGGVDVVINVAGGDAGRPGDFTELDDETWTRMSDLNLVGAVRVIRAALPHLRSSARRPAIVSVSSVNALNTFGSVPYSAAKAGLGPMTMNLAQSEARHGIRVNLVAPATVRTRNWDDQPGGADRMAPLYPLGRVAEPADIAAAVAFLASADAAWITGQTLAVEGGVLTSLATRFLQMSD